ncbi:MAG: M48 family metallopeptidase [Prevotella sp.]|nr:M48 family metallopeptidase [Prevotella sp.]
MKIRYFISMLLLSVMLLACGTTNVVPITGRKQRINVDEASTLSLSNQEYHKFIQQAKISTNATNTAMVKRVGQKLATAVETYLRNNGYAAEVQNYNWEFNLVADNQANAFCMPGGKIVVYEGILPITQTEAGLAIVLGHEIAHAVAKHSAEQMTKQQNSELLGGVVNSVLGSVAGANTASTLSQLYGLGSQMATLHYSRKHENEADHIGLIFAAMAGYDPNEALVFWQRMAASSSNSTPEFFSTHPSDATRIANIQKLLPTAMQYYNSATGKPNTSTTPKTSGTFRVK